jgi:fibro-slime domain-containing protein
MTQRTLSPLWVVIGLMAACGSERGPGQASLGANQPDAGQGRHADGAGANALPTAVDNPGAIAGSTGTASMLDAGSAGDAGLVRDAAVSCDHILRAIVRDFRESHPDFENRAFINDVAFPGIVKNELGADQKPVYASSGPTRETTGPKEFAEWYHDVLGVNAPFDVEIPLTKDGTGKYVYDNFAFFPIDGKGPSERNDAAGKPRNFHFTTEIHTQFDYRGGEVFAFVGDDDVWVFINGKLAIDLGGLHRTLRQSVDLNAAAAKLGITPGKRYSMDIFHAERMATESNFHLETTIDCLIPVVLL